MSVTLLQIDSSFLFLNGIEPFLGRQFSVWHSTKRCFQIFDLGPLIPKFAPQNFGTKSPKTSLVRQIEGRCLYVLGDFRGWSIQLNHKCCGVDPCCHGNEILANFGYFLHKIAYKSACMPDRPDMFGPTRGPNRGADPCCHGNDMLARRGV